MNNFKTKSGLNVPPIGLGTFPLQGLEMAKMIKEAYLLGYRLFDTSDDYRGETGIGIGIKKLEEEKIATREDLFIQTKISADGSYSDEFLAGLYFNDNSPFASRMSVEDLVREKVDTSLRELQTSYIDSVLIHLPYPNGYKEQIWHVLCSLKNEGKIRFIGVSNFHRKHIEDIEKTGETPLINEIYISPLNIKNDDLIYNHSRDISVMSYSPLMDLAQKRINVNVLQPIMKKYNKTAGQIILRWNIDRGCIPLPRTCKTIRLKENFDVFDFELSTDEINTISAMHCGYQYLVESKICPGI